MKVVIAALIAVSGLIQCQSAPGAKPKEESNMQENSSGGLLNIDKFWDIVESSKKGALNKEDQLHLIEVRLSKLSPEDILSFRLQTDKLLYDSYTSELWCAAYVINGGCSDDGFQYFRCWLISEGKTAYHESLKDPDQLINYASDNDEENEFEDFWYVAHTPYTQKTGKDIYDAIPAGFAFSEGKYKPIQFTWEEDKPETMKKICPRLFNKFWK